MPYKKKIERLRKRGFRQPQLGLDKREKKLQRKRSRKKLERARKNRGRLLERSERRREGNGEGFG